MQSKQLQSIIAQKDNYKTKQGDDFWLLVPEDKSKRDKQNVLKLNATAAFLWDEVDDDATIDDLISKIRKKYKVDKPTAEKDVKTFLNDLENYL